MRDVGRLFHQRAPRRLTSVLDAATALSEQFTDYGSDVTRPIADEAVRERVEAGFELFHTSSAVTIFIADGEGDQLLKTDSDQLNDAPVPAEVLDSMTDGKDYFAQTDLGGMLASKHYVAGRRIQTGQDEAYLFVCASTQSLYHYLEDSLGIFLFSAAAILLFATLISILLARKISAPSSRSARRRGSLAAGISPPARRLTAVRNSLILRRPSTTWPPGCRRSTTPAASSWATLRMSCAPR